MKKIIQIIMDLLSNKGYVHYSKMIAHTLGVNEAIIIGELASEHDYWEKNNKLTIIEGKEYFYSTRENIKKQTELGEDAQRRAINNLKEKKILEVKRMGLPSKNYYRIDLEQLSGFLTSRSQETEDK